jgi:hypothetical protein
MTTPELDTQFLTLSKLYDSQVSRNATLLHECTQLKLMIGSLLAVLIGDSTPGEIKRDYGELGWDVVRRANNVLDGETNGY